MISDDIIITRRSSERPICGVAALWIVLLKQYFFFLLTPNIEWLNSPTYDGPTYKGQAKCFSSWSLLGLSKLSNKYITDQFKTVIARRQISPFALIINPANKNGCSAWGYPFIGAWDYSFCNTYRAYKGYYSSFAQIPEFLNLPLRG